jgi:FkbM family methyltransferase
MSKLAGARMKETKRHFLSFFKRTGIYHRLRASSAYDLYLKLTKNELLKAKERESDFYRAMLDGFNRGDLIFDIGANVGDRTDAFLRVGARVIAVDPDEHNQAILREKFLRYRLSPKSVTIVGKAVGARTGVDAMLVYASGSGFNSLSLKSAGILERVKERRIDDTLDALELSEEKIVETTTLEDLINTYGLPFFIKIDVVGYEMEVLRGLRRSVPYLSFEIDLPALREEFLQCIEILGRLSARGQFNYTCDRRNGFALDGWVDLVTFSRVLDGCNCDKGCVEVFWRTPRQSAQSEKRKLAR